MNWDKLYVRLYRNFRKSPFLVTLIAYELSKIPLSHCGLASATPTCSEIPLNLFVISFPYQNIVKFLFNALFAAGAVEIMYRIYIRFIAKPHVDRLKTKMAYLEERARPYQPLPSEISEQFIKAHKEISEFEMKYF